MSEPITADFWSHCNRCMGDRRHVVLAEESTNWEEEVSPGMTIGGDDNFKLLKCKGCDWVHTRHDSRYSQDTDENGYPNVTTTFYPPKITRRAARWTHDMAWVFMFDQPIKKLHDEIYRALASQSLRLVTMGIRALIETAIIEKVKDRGTFAAGLDALHQAGHISLSQRAHLDQVIEGGHATIHRAFAPSEADVHALLDIAEHVIEALYITPERAKALEGKFPPRGAPT